MKRHERPARREHREASYVKKSKLRGRERERLWEAIQTASEIFTGSIDEATKIAQIHEPLLAHVDHLLLVVRGQVARLQAFALEVLDVLLLTLARRLRRAFVANLATNFAQNLLLGLGQRASVEWKVEVT